MRISVKTDEIVLISSLLFAVYTKLLFSSPFSKRRKQDKEEQEKIQEKRNRTKVNDNQHNSSINSHYPEIGIITYNVLSDPVLSATYSMIPKRNI